ncbi:hypothetical protein [Saccharopolyspora shandongensis]|uniref:hypothetical protein n=1 Tax=Saccharopolyspora shandongensis TaxID=418495 RepID=UPI003404C7C7
MARRAPPPVRFGRDQGAQSTTGPIDGLDPSLREQLAAYSVSLAGRLPPEAAHMFLSWWIRLYGLLCMEVLNQLDFAFSDLRPVFEDCLRGMCGELGLDYEPAD